MRIFTFIAISVAVLPGAATDIRAGQSPTASQEATGAITGRVTIESEAAPGVVVALQQATGSRPLAPPVARATTDKEGNFKMTNLPAGRYYLIPLAPAYFAPSEDREVESGKPVTLMKGENLEGIELKLIPGGVITGRVTTAGGQPLIGRGIYMRLTDPRASQLLPTTIHGEVRFKTDDRGVYRVYGLPAGRYIVSVRSETPGQASSVYHPGVTEDSHATPVDVMAGLVVENVDIKLPPITPAYEARGRVVDEATGQPIPKIMVGWSALEANSKKAISFQHGPMTDGRGAFRITNLTLGRYAVSVPINSGSEYYSDEVFFEMADQDVAGLEVRARRAASLSGVVVIEGARDPSIPADLGGFHISVFRQAGGLGAGGDVGADGRFRIAGLPPDKFRLYLHSKTQRERFRLLGVERDGVRLQDLIEVGAGEQVMGLRLIVTYGSGVVHGRVQVVGGTLPEGARLSVSARRADLPDQPSAAPSVSVDSQGRFLLEGLATGVHEILLMVYVPSPSGRTPLSPLRPPVRQTISVTNGTESEVTLVLDLNASSVKEEKR